MTVLTRWGEQLDPAAPLPEYPRPQLVRERWQNLNGVWDVAFTPFDRRDGDGDGDGDGHGDGGGDGDGHRGDGGSPRGDGSHDSGDDPLAVADPTVPPREWDGEIVVPFSPETALSGVGRTLQSHETLWYRRTFTADHADRERVILHLDAVDQSCRIAVDGVEVASHTGGYLPVVVDVTAALTDRVEHELVVAVRDVTDAAWLARGKQSSSRGGIWYTPQSGIWQTVWLEVVPRVAVDSLVLTPHLEAGEIEVTVGSEYPGAGDAVAEPLSATVTVRADGQVVASTTVPVGQPTRVALPQPVRTWSPEGPFLYDVEITLGDDRVRSYVGMRSFGVGSDAAGTPRLLLNGQPYLAVGLLDQGYWPDGGYTAPSDDALEYDIRLAKRLGYTMLRKHIKVEPLRWYHHCDRLGMLVWQDAVNGGTAYKPQIITAPAFGAPPIRDDRYRAFGRADERGRERFEAELVEMVEHLRSVPSIALWVPFNEAWGQFDAARIAALVRDLDPTRPVDHASGWHDQGAGDLRSLHIYFRPVRPRRRRDDRVLAVTEYGGYSLVVPGHTFGTKVFGYRRYRSREKWQAAFERLHEREIAPAVRNGVAALVYTQLSDVEDEVNGLVTYDRRFVKADEQRTRRMNDALRAAAAESGGHPDDHDHDRNLEERA